LRIGFQPVKVWQFWQGILSGPCGLREVSMRWEPEAGVCRCGNGAATPMINVAAKIATTKNAPFGIVETKSFCFLAGSTNSSISESVSWRQSR
jgi:hypothetical protein